MTGTPQEVGHAQLVTQLGDAVGGPEVPADPETPASDRRHAEWEMRRMAESFVMTGGIRGQIGDCRP